MASTYSTDLKLELMATGEKAGEWGNITNTNLVIIQQAIAGYETVAFTGSDVTLSIANGVLSNGKNATLELTGTLSANVNCIVPDSIEKIYQVNNSCVMGVYTLTFKTATGTGVNLAQGNRYTLYSDGTNVNLIQTEQVWRTVSATATIQPGSAILANTNGGAITITLPASPSAGDTCSFIDQGYDFNTNALTIGRNSSNIANAAADLVINTQGAGFSLVYSGDATTGWTYKDK